MAYEALRRALITLDAISARGGGQLVPVPQPVGQIMAATYHDLPFLAWPKADFDAINSEWASMGYYGGPPSPFANGMLSIETNNEIARVIAANPNSLNALVLLKMGTTVDQARAGIRARLKDAGVKEGPPATPTKRFPWGWVLGTLALGAGVTLAVIFNEHAHAHGDEQ